MADHIGELLHDYLDDEMNEVERTVIEKHLDNCSECKNRLFELTSLRQQMLDAYQLIEIPNRIEDKILANIEQESIKIYAVTLNRTAIIMMSIFGIIFLAGTTPFLTVGFHIINMIFSISRGLIYAIPSIISTIPYVVASVALFIILLIAMALFIVRYLVHNIGKTVGAEDI